MRILIANIDKVLAEYRSSHQRCSLSVYKIKKIRRYHYKKPVLESVCNKVYLKETSTQVFFTVENFENFENNYFEEL